MIDIQSLLASRRVAYAEHHEVLDSTQARARTLADLTVSPKISLPALVVADRQTAGRGRGSNRWWTGEGSLAFSLLLDPDQFSLPRRPIPRLSLAVGVAVIDAVSPRLVDYPLGLHWPNDVYVGPGKLAGILVEVLPDGRYIIGVGLNSNNSATDAPVSLRESIASLSDLTGRAHDHTELLSGILENLAAAIQQLSAPSDPLGQRFDLLCRQHGQELSVYQGNQIITGRCAGIAPDGALLLDTSAGLIAIHSGTLKPNADW